MNPSLWLVETNFLARANAVFICFYAFLLMIVFFSSRGKVVLKQIIHSGQLKRIFWVVEKPFFIYFLDISTNDSFFIV